MGVAPSVAALRVASNSQLGGRAWARDRPRAHLDEPIDENCTHGGIDIALRLHVLGGNSEDQLSLAQVRVDVSGIRFAALKDGVGLLDFQVQAHGDGTVSRRCMPDHLLRWSLARLTIRLRLQHSLPRGCQSRHTHIDASWLVGEGSARSRAAVAASEPSHAC
jgi:hypothetical protein